MWEGIACPDYLVIITKRRHMSYSVAVDIFCIVHGTWQYMQATPMPYVCFPLTTRIPLDACSWVLCIYNHHVTEYLIIIIFYYA